MSFRGVKSFLLACTSAAVIVTASVEANAGGFALREQSAYGQGASFAGIAAGGALSAMFWNPAVITQYKGKAFEQVITGILPYSSHSFTTTTFPALGTPGNHGIDALVPAGYSSWQITDKLWVGMSMNAPFGLGVRFPQLSAAAVAASGNSANVQSYNFAPTVAYKINDMISVAFGVQAQYLKASYDIFLSATPLLIGSLNGAGWGFGWTAGVTITPTRTTQIGIGYRSSIDQKVNGNLDVPAAAGPASRGSVNLTLPLPDTLTVGLRQSIGDKFTLLAGIEWSNWSRIGTPVVFQPSGVPATIGANVVQFPFQYNDGWFYSLGGEYAFNPALTVRAGIGFEKSPIADNKRTVRIPDNDRIWYSLGATYKPASLPRLTFDLGYSFVDVKNAPICMGPAASGCPTNPWSGAATYIGAVKSHVNIVSLALRYQWDNDPAPKPRLITK